MESQYILPFANATRHVCGTMLKTEVSFDKPYINEGSSPSHDVSGIIGFTGFVTGSIVVSFPLEVACTLMSRFIGEEVGPDHPDFADAIGELVNMIAGAAKAEFNQDNINISCPSVVRGKDLQVLQRRGHPIVSIPCSCELGKFEIEVALKKAEAAADTAAA